MDELFYLVEPVEQLSDGRIIRLLFACEPRPVHTNVDLSTMKTFQVVFTASETTATSLQGNSYGMSTL